MREIESLIKGLCIDYSLALERIFNESKNRSQLLEERAKLQEDIKQRYEKRLSTIPENQRKMPAHFDIAKKYMDTYSESLNKVINGETKSRPALKRQREDLKKNINYLYGNEIKRTKNKNRNKIFTGAVASAVVAGGILAGTLSSQNRNAEEPVKDKEPAVSDTMPQEDGKGLPSEEYYSQVVDGVPEVRSYTNDNGEFLRLDNIVDINVWAYNEVASELKAYQEANPDAKYDFDMTMISPEIGCGLMIAESSGAINSNKNNASYQGPYSVGVSPKYIESINVVSRALNGENCIDPTNVNNEVQDPRIACKAYLYDIIENYRQLKYALRDADLSDVEITQRLLIDSYLNGATGAVEKITKGKDHQRPYADKIMEYAEVFEEYAESLTEHPEIRNLDSSEYGRNAHKRLNEITKEYSDSPTRGGNSSAEEME